jgi:hypothetical protein
MKRLGLSLLITAVLVSLVIASPAGAQTIVKDFSNSTIFQTCGGGIIFDLEVTGTQILTIQPLPNGGQVFVNNSHGTATGTSTNGVTYTGTWVTGGRTVIAPSGLPFVDTTIYRIRLVGSDGVVNFLKLTVHVTYSATGDLTVQFVNASLECQ